MILPAPHKGFALLISMIFVSVVLALGVSLLDVAYKQILLSSSARQSEIAFYNADSAMECGLYWDQKFNAFGYANPAPLGNIVCDTRAVSGATTNVSGATRVTSFYATCAAGGTSALVTVYKQSDGTTNIYSDGYNTCDASISSRIERGLKVHY